MDASKFKDRYFVRCLTYDMMDGHVLLHDNKSPRVITLDPWLEVIYAAADGQRTASEFIAQLKESYPDGAPAGLEQQTYRLLAKMEYAGLIRLSEQKVRLPYYLSMPNSEQDRERALAEMKRDGLIE